ncbi:MAG: PAS domain-containing protein [Bacteroidales bacterium]|nr:PAS domain-containing protein [Bacteroidales bacterium]MCF8402944.1 PAS domain-containing protein [Bacteroidales bacterium]
MHDAQTFNKTLLDASPDIIYVYDLDARKNIYSNEGIVSMLGYSIDEIQKMGDRFLAELMHVDDFIKYQKKILPAYPKLKDGEFIEHDYRIKHKDGSWRWLNSREFVFNRFDAGNPRQIFGITTDVTLQKHNENTLKENIERQKLVLNSFPVVFYTVDPSGKMPTTWISDQVKNITGFSADEITSNSDFWTSRLHPKDRDRTLKEYNSVIKNDYVETEYRWKVASGSYKWFKDKIILLKNEDGSPRQIIGFWIDENDRIIAENELNEKIEKLEKWNKLTIGRELKMIELKEEINQLLLEMGRTKKYKIPSNQK